MTTIDTTFHEVTADRRTASVPLSHLSLELGHLYLEDFAGGPDRLDAHFRRVAPWVDTARQQFTQGEERSTPRISTCFLIDDYFTRFSSPAELMPLVIESAERHGLRIDYVARESGCAVTDRTPLAQLVTGQLAAIPSRGTDGTRPPVLESGWLSNGQRSPGDTVAEAMGRPAWEPPAEIGATNHSVFVDVELWSERDSERLWSCAYLAAVWQLLRLGILRHDGADVVDPQTCTDGFPADWDELPPIVRLNPTAAPFSAYRTLSVLPSRFLQIEHAVRVILNQIVPARDVLDQIAARSAGENIAVPDEVTERLDYVFFGGG